jgi:hypothetical protein
MGLDEKTQWTTDQHQKAGFKLKKTGCKQKKWKKKLRNPMGIRNKSYFRLYLIGMQQQCVFSTDFIFNLYQFTDQIIP